MDADVMLDDFILCELGDCGQVDLVQKTDSTLRASTLPCGIPPVLPSLTEELEHYLTNPQILPYHDLNKAQVFIPRTADPVSILSTSLCPVDTDLHVLRNPSTGEIRGFEEISISDASKTAKNSTSLKRNPGPASEAIYGNSTNYPFWPGGLEEPNLEELLSIEELTFENLDTVPPGFDKGVDFGNEDVNSLENISPNVLNLSDIMDEADFFDDEIDDDDDSQSNTDAGFTAKSSADDISTVDDALLDTVLEKEVPVLDISKAVPLKMKNTEWTEIMDVTKPVPDFYKRIPNLAHEWPFELDTFQKQAIICLENHDSVFVAAHTSAGKTVVAEYAIAMSQKHMTRSIYTSPIKALSNQKFRDFKAKFDVGLITGDVQLRPEASCLIMTTEILRSMLYNGSDIIRDLEWVIFDEVHYINDAERGVVWEEVLIMLPKHVSIILLSATVPNTVEFADWIGRTKKKKIYVISTQKRPVPLEHYLYTGTTGKSRNECFLLIDSQGNFIDDGYQLAMTAKKDRSSKSQQGFGAKGLRTGTKAAQEKNIYITLLEYLQEKNKLPVVCFTFSRKRCDVNSDMLSSVDLTTASEKREIRLFTQKCISKLRGPDKKIPQVNKLKCLMERGIAVHHSGILPILKEIVEMLFHEGLIKLLFATETFAMGVNMPARTVVFDSIRKHDGTNFRDLLSGEYIQMAGRAGRRGHDTTGTVILLCKIDVPEKSDLHKMMLGRPTRLESRFRITYSMILNLLRVEQLRIEDMMKRSFFEAGSQKDTSKFEQKLNNRFTEIKQTELLDCEDCTRDVEAYYRRCKEYIGLKSKLWNESIVRFPSFAKVVCQGRVVVIYAMNQSDPVSCPAIIVSPSSKVKGKNISVLVLFEDNGDNAESTLVFEPSEESRYIAFSRSEFQSIQGKSGHCIVDISYDDIVHVLNKVVKVDCDKVTNDVKKRQQPRFRDNPPSSSTLTAVQELSSITKNISGIGYLNLAKEFGVKDIDLVLNLQSLECLQKRLSKDFVCTGCFSFQKHFGIEYQRIKIQEQIDELKFRLSEDSLQLLPEYRSMLQVLQQLGYIDATKTVKMKGRVSCGMGNHELMITEMIYDNVFTFLPPEEIAALLSCLVFQQKTENEPELTVSLQQGVNRIKNVADRIGQAQKSAGLSQPVDDYINQFKFGLTEVVYKWAKGMSFEKITELTDVQEGIIVKCIQRLDETLRDVKDAARIVGDPVLSAKVESASICIRRDIVFAASLYTQ